MSDINNEETKPSDIVGTDKEFKRVEQTLPVQHQSKGLQPIIPLDSGNRKNGRTIGSMGIRQEKSLTDIDSIGQSSVKEINNIVAPPSRQEKSNQDVTSNTDREYKQGEEITPSYNRSIKHQELEKDIQRLVSKRDANVDAEVLHKEKKESEVQSPMANARKTEQQFKELSHFAKKEMNIFESFDHGVKQEKELDQKNTDINKQEVETNLPISDTVKQEKNTNILSTGIKKQEEETIISSNAKKQEVEAIVQDPKLKKSESEISSSDDRINKTEKNIYPKSELLKREVDINIQDPKIEKTEVKPPIDDLRNESKKEKDISSYSNRNDKDWEQTTGDEHFPSLQKDEKEVQYNTTKIEKGSVRDFDPNRELKAGIDGITAESTVDAIITSNYSFVDSPEPGFISDAKKITTKKSTKQVHNLSFDNVFSEFENALSSNIKEDKNLNTNTLGQNNKTTQTEENHTISAFTNIVRPNKTQDSTPIQPSNINTRSIEDRSDLSSIAITDTPPRVTGTEDHTIRGITESERPSKPQTDLNNTDAQPLNTNERLIDERSDLSKQSIDQKSTLTIQDEVDHTKSSVSSLIRSGKSQDIINKVDAYPNNIDKRTSEDRSDLSSIAISSTPPRASGTEDHTIRGITESERDIKKQDIINKVDAYPNNIDKRTDEDRYLLTTQSVKNEKSEIEIQKEVDHTKSSLPDSTLSINRPSKPQTDLYITDAQPLNTDERINEDRSDLSEVAISNTPPRAMGTEDHTIRGIIGSDRLKKSQDIINKVDAYPNNIDKRTSEDRSDLSKSTPYDNPIAIDETIDFSTRSIGPYVVDPIPATANANEIPGDRGSKLNKGTNDLFGDAIVPIVATSAPGNTITYRPERQGDQPTDKGFGISTGSIVSMFRPIGLFKRIENGIKGNVGDLVSAGLNAALPYLNEARGAAGSTLADSGPAGKIISNLVSGSQAIPLTGAFARDAGNTTDDVLNYTRHAMINGIRALSNRVVDELFINGKVDDSDKNQIMKGVDKEVSGLYEDNYNADGTSFIPATPSENIRGVIKKDQKSILGVPVAYSNSKISNSPAVKYKSYSDYINTLKVQIAGLNNPFGTTEFNEDDINDKLLRKYSSINNNNPQEKQMKIMIEQFISFSSKLTGTGYLNVSERGFEKADGKNTDESHYGIYGNETAFNDTQVFDIKKPNLKNNDYHISSAFMQSASKEDLVITHRNGKSIFKENMISRFENDTLVYDGETENSTERESERHLNFMSTGIEGSSRSSIQSDINLRLVSEKILNYSSLFADDAYSNYKNDPLFISAYLTHANREEIDDYTITDRNIKKNTYKKLLDEDADHTLFLSDMNFASEDQKAANINLLNSGVFSRMKFDSTNLFDIDGEKYTISSATKKEDFITSYGADYEQRSAKDIYAKYINKIDSISYEDGLADLSNLTLGGNYGESILSNQEYFINPFYNENDIFIVDKDKRKENYNDIIIKESYNNYYVPSAILPKTINDKIIRGEVSDIWVKNTSSFTGEDIYGAQYPITQRHIKDDFFFIGDNNSWNELGREDKSLLGKLKTVNYENKDLIYPSGTRTEKATGANNIDVNVNDYENKPYGVYNVAKDIAHTSNIANQPVLFKDNLEITEFTKETKDAKLKFDRHIFGGTINRRDITNSQEDWLKEIKTKMTTDMGKIIVNPNPVMASNTNYWITNDNTTGVVSPNHTVFTIPFQFNVEITGESRQASWSSHTGYGRTSEFYTWNNTASRQVSLKTVYIITDALKTDKISYKRTDEGESSPQYPPISFAHMEKNENLPKNLIYNTFNSGHGGWAPGYIHKIIVSCSTCFSYRL